MNKERASSKKILGRLYDSDPFADVRIHLDKDMSYESNSDASRGWTGTLSGMVPKKKESNVVMLVTYDGAGHEFFSVDSEMSYGKNGNLTDQFQHALDKKFGEGKYHIEHNTGWSFSVYWEEK